MIKKVIFIFSIISLLLAFHSKAQNLTLLSKHTDKEIKLRWIPDSIKVWEDGNKYGYRLIRYTYERQGKRLQQEDANFIFPSPQKPKNEAYFKSLAQQGNTYASMVGELLYNAKPTTPEDTEDANTYKYIFSLFCADMSADVAAGLALAYTDKNVRNDEKYRYEVSIAYPDTRNRKASITTDLNARDFESPIQNITVSYLDSTATLQFDMVNYIAYNIERSDDGGVTYHKTNATPIMATFDEDNPNSTMTVYSDKVPSLYKNYFYRAKAITPFALESPASDVVKIYAYNTNLPSPSNIQHLLNKQNEVLLSWNYPDSLLTNLKGFKISYQESLADSVYNYVSDTILSKNNQRFIHKPIRNEGFYVIVAIDLQNRELGSMPHLVQIEDTIPPLQPKSFIGNVTKKGIVTLNWNKNSEYDLYGYQIYRSNFKENGYSLITKGVVSDTVLVDTLSLKLLHKKVYYLVVALDNHLNASKAFDTLVINRPDILPPSAPSIQKFELKNESVSLNWNNSSSDDILEHILFRKAYPDTTRKILLRYQSKNNVTSFKDSTIEEGRLYQYILQAFDESNLSSNEEDCQLKIEVTPPHYRKPINNVKAIYKKRGENVLLSWQYQHPKYKVNNYAIFRLDEGQVLRKYKLVTAEKNEFEDLKPIHGQRHAYAIVAYLEDGSETLPNDLIFVEIPPAKNIRK